jgi:O-glycosyl hydrolase
MKGISVIYFLSVAVNVCFADVNTWLTSANSNGDATKLIDWEGSFNLYSSKQLPPVVNSSWTNEVTLTIDLNNVLQTMVGFGAGLPQSSAYSLKLLRDRNADVYWQLLTKLFSEANYGANMNILRFPIGACDFSMTNTSYDESSNDYNLDHFSIDSDSYMIVTVLQDILKVNPRMILIGEDF